MKNRLFLLVLVNLFIYFQIIGNQLQTLWDDQWMIINPYTSGGFTWENIRAIFTETYEGQYSPVNQLIYTFIYSIGGYNPAGFHLYSLLLHIANTCLVYVVLRKAIVNGRRAKSYHAEPVAFFTALLFAVHPMNVESVAWASASKVLLFSFFSLLCFNVYLNYIRNGKWQTYLLAFVLFAFSCASKEQAVVLPACLFLFDLLLRRNLMKKEVWIEKLPFLFFAILVGLFTLSLQSASLINERAGYPFGQRMVLACYSIIEYVIKLIIPANLLYIYPFPMQPGEELPLKFYMYPVLATGLFTGAIIYRKKWTVSFGALFFLINIALALHIVPMSRYAMVADRYVYLPAVGIFLIAVWHVFAYYLRLTKQKRRWMYICAVGYILFLGIYAHQRTKVWYDSDTLKKEMRDLLEERNKYETTSQDEKRTITLLCSENDF